MKTFSRVAIAMLTMTGVAFAQPKAPAGGTPAKPADPKTATPAKPADPKAGAPAMKDAKAADPKAAPAAPMTPPKAPAEIATMFKATGGNWRCTGTGMAPDMQMTKMTATMKSKSDLDGFWIQDTFEGKMGKAKFKFVAYTTYDPTSKKWRRVSVDNMGAQMIGTSDGLKDNKVDFNMDTMGGMGPGGMFRDHVELVDAKNVKAWGEATMDKGKTWMKVYEMACKK